MIFGNGGFNWNNYEKKLQGHFWNYRESYERGQYGLNHMGGAPLDDLSLTGSMIKEGLEHNIAQYNELCAMFHRAKKVDRERAVRLWNRYADCYCKGIPFPYGEPTFDPGPGYRQTGEEKKRAEQEDDKEFIEGLTAILAIYFLYVIFTKNTSTALWVKLGSVGGATCLCYWVLHQLNWLVRLVRTFILPVVIISAVLYWLFGKA